MARRYLPDWLRPQGRRAPPPPPLPPAFHELPPTAQRLWPLLWEASAGGVVPVRATDHALASVLRVSRRAVSMAIAELCSASSGGARPALLSRQMVKGPREIEGRTLMVIWSPYRPEAREVGP